MDTGWGTLIALGAGLVQKHVFKKLPNSWIPYLNFGLTTGIGWATTGDFQLGLQFGAQSTGQAMLGHGLVKPAVKKVSGRSI